MSDSAWTIEALKALLDERYATQTKAVDAAFAAAERAVQAALTSAEKAVSKAEIAADKRFELLNELRQGIATEAQLHAVEKMFSALAARVDRIEGRSKGLGTGISVAAALVGLVLTVLIIVAYRNSGG